MKVRIDSNRLGVGPEQEEFEFKPPITMRQVRDLVRELQNAGLIPRKNVIAAMNGPKVRDQQKIEALLNDHTDEGRLQLIQHLLDKHYEITLLSGQQNGRQEISSATEGTNGSKKSPAPAMPHPKKSRKRDRKKQRKLANSAV